MRTSLAAFACLALAASVPAAAMAQQVQRNASGTAAASRSLSSDDDGFIPPMRGTPDGRISGASRGPHASATTADVDTAKPHVTNIKTTKPVTTTTPSH